MIEMPVLLIKNNECYTIEIIIFILFYSIDYQRVTFNGANLEYILRIT